MIKRLLDFFKPGCALCANSKCLPRGNGKIPLCEACFSYCAYLFFQRDL